MEKQRKAEMALWSGKLQPSVQSCKSIEMIQTGSHRSQSSQIQSIISCYTWLSGSMVERRSLIGELSLSAPDLQLMDNHLYG